MWHLLFREATRADLGIVSEDGVRELDEIMELTMTVGAEPCALVLDGEVVDLSPHTVVTMKRVEGLDMKFLCP
jgi:hypothetical protein